MTQSLGCSMVNQVRFAKVGTRQRIGIAGAREGSTGRIPLCLVNSETHPSKRGSIGFISYGKSSSSSNQRKVAGAGKNDRQKRSVGLCTSLSRSGPTSTAADSQVLVSLYKFSRPHTMLGTFISVLSVSFLALHPFSLSFYTAKVIMQALVPALLMNICIVGLNQIYDVEIDKINKPYLPLAAGEWSVGAGWWIVVGTGLLSLILGYMSQSWPLLCTLIGSLVLGIAYSTDVPMLRWKKHPLIAATCILSVRAVLVQLGFYAHMKTALGLSIFPLGGGILFATGFMLLFSIVIALFKDIPDLDGDQHSGVLTLTVRLGRKRVYWICIAILEVLYLLSVGYSLVSKSNIVGVLSAALHASVGTWIFFRAQKTDLESSESIYSCYMDIWKAFYAEYILLPFFS